MDYVKAIAQETEDIGQGNDALPVNMAAFHTLVPKHEPSTPDTLMLAERSLTMPRQPDETSSVEER